MRIDIVEWLKNIWRCQFKHVLVNNCNYTVFIPVVARYFNLHVFRWKPRWHHQYFPSNTSSKKAWIKFFIGPNCHYQNNRKILGWNFIQLVIKHVSTYTTGNDYITFSVYLLSLAKLRRKIRNRQGNGWWTRNRLEWRRATGIYKTLLLNTSIKNSLLPKWCKVRKHI